MTIWQQHKEKWSTCTACGLCERRQNVVLLRGSIPAQVLFVGEAPGQSEDTLGRPFCGPAGQLLDRIISAAFSEYTNQPTYALTNLIACIPLGEGSVKVSEPPVDSIKACAPRLREIFSIVSPKLVVYVGRLPEIWFPREVDLTTKEPAHDGIYIVPQVSIIHPAAILRMNPVQQPLAIKRAVVVISDAIGETLDLC